MTSIDKSKITANEDAAMWLSRKNSRVWSAADEEAFNEWLNADPLHRATYEEVTHTWQQFAQLQRPALVRRPVKKASLQGLWRDWFTGLVQYRYRVFALLALLLVVGGSGWYTYDQTAQYVTHVSTVGQEGQQMIALPDGSRVTANKHTELAIRYYPGRREVNLKQGEAYFEVASQDDMFTVIAGNTSVHVLGTVFNVQTSPERTAVKVAQGTVRIKTGSIEPVLHAGDTIRIDSLTKQAQTGNTQASSVGAWRNGQLVFRNASLQDVVDELSFYLDKPVTLADAGLKYKKLSGYAKTEQAEAFLQSLPELLAVNVLQMKDGSYRIVVRS